MPQQDHRHPATVPVEVGHREGLGTDQLPHRRAPGHRVLGLAGGEPGAGVDVVAGAEPLQLAELVGLQLLEPDDVDVVLGEQVDDAGHPGHAGLLAAGAAARVAAAEHVERADREVGGRPAGRRRDRRTGRGVRRGVGGRHVGKRGGLRVRECVRRHGGRRDPGDVAVVEAAGVREAGRGEPGGEVGVAGGGAGCPGRVGACCAAGRATGEGRAVIVTATVGWRRGSCAEAVSETGCSGAVSSPPHAPRRTEPSRTPVSATAAPAVVVAVARLNSFSSAGRCTPGQALPRTSAGTRWS